MAGNSLVAAPVDLTTPFSGTFLLEDGEALCMAISSGDWVAGGMAAFSLALDGISMALDPIGSLIAMGLGWLMDHIEPLKGWLNDLTGDAGEVAGFAGTWQNIAAHLQQAGVSLEDSLRGLAGMQGQAADAFRAFHTDAAKHLAASGEWAGAIGTGMTIASTIVKMVHDMTRDAISTVVGTAASAALTTVVTVGFGAPVAVAQVASKVASLAGKLTKFITNLLKSVKQLIGLVEELVKLFRKLMNAVQDALRNLPTRTPDAPTTRPPGSGADTPGGAAPAGTGGGPPSGTGGGSPGGSGAGTPGGTGASDAPRPGDELPVVPEPRPDPDRIPVPGTDKTVDPVEYQAVRDASVHNPDADQVMLGKWEGDDNPSTYFNQAGDDYEYFSLGKDWDDVKASQGLEDADMFEMYNKPFLDDAMDAGKPFQFSHDPRQFPNSFLFSEFEYIKASGQYAWDNVNLIMIPIG